LTNLTGQVTYDYSANPCYTIKDEAANSPTSANPGSIRQTCPDALGRIASVTETSAPGSPVTTYAYDARNNLTGVTQGQQTRTFVYDPLGEPGRTRRFRVFGFGRDKLPNSQ
jgi:YD repeat-containing protein